MPKRVVLNVASGGGYVWGQQRMYDSLVQQGWDVNNLMRWTNSLPPGSPSHQEVPYGFKMFAFKAAIEQGFTSLLWLDAAAWVVKPLDPFFERIERDGHYFFHGGAMLGQRCSDTALEYFGCSRDQAMGIPLIGGTVYGFDLTNPRTNKFFQLWWEYYEAGLFVGPAINRINEENMRALAGRPVGDCSADPRCQGHCHDESAATWAAHVLGMKSVGIGDGFAPYCPESAADLRVFVVSQGL